MKSAPPFPTSLRIGPADFKVIDWPTRAALMVNRYGECDHTEKEIRVCRDHGPRKAAETLLHEMLHAIFAEWVIKPKDDEERTVTTLAGAIQCAWRDNPEAFDWIRAATLEKP